MIRGQVIVIFRVLGEIDRLGDHARGTRRVCEAVLLLERTVLLGRLLNHWLNLELYSLLLLMLLLGLLKLILWLIISDNRYWLLLLLRPDYLGGLLLPDLLHNLKSFYFFFAGLLLALGLM